MLAISWTFFWGKCMCAHMCEGARVCACVCRENIQSYTHSQGVMGGIRYKFIVDNLELLVSRVFS